MRFALIPLALLTATAIATQVPACASRCIAKAVSKTSCAAADTQCLCQSDHFLPYLRFCSNRLCNDMYEKRDAVDSMSQLCSLLVDDEAQGSTNEALATQKDSGLRLQRRNQPLTDTKHPKNEESGSKPKAPKHKEPSPKGSNRGGGPSWPEPHQGGGSGHYNPAPPRGGYGNHNPEPPHGGYGNHHPEPPHGGYGNHHPEPPHGGYGNHNPEPPRGGGGHHEPQPPHNGGNYPPPWYPPPPTNTVIPY